MLIELLKLNKNDEIPLYRQLTAQIAELIRKQVIKPGYRFPGSRKMAAELGIHRKTVVAAIDQLVIEGWLETNPGKGTYVSEHFDSGPEEFNASQKNQNKATFIHIPNSLQRNLQLTTQKYHLDDGLPDARLAPVAEMIRAYKSALSGGNTYSRFAYSDTKGQYYLRQVLCEYLKESRAINVSPDQIIITRGVTQALYLCIQGLLKPGDKVAVGELNWESANANLEHYGIELVKIKVDEDGFNTDHLEEILLDHKIQMVYCTPHHQYPTTVIMPATRRLKLIQLARTYGFYVFEDDYDYDFYYSTHPVMPLASAEHGDFVLYAGSFTKAISPVFRVGYLVANPNQIDYLSRIRRMVDRQGDSLLELAIAELLKLGVIQSSLRKNRKIYLHRRDYFARLLKTYLSDYLQFELPQGGMSIWTHFDQAIDLNQLQDKAAREDLFITNGAQVSASYPQLNATRLGFASSNEEELEESVKILKRLILR